MGAKRVASAARVSASQSHESEADVHRGGQVYAKLPQFGERYRGKTTKNSVPAPSSLDASISPP